MSRCILYNADIVNDNSRFKGYVVIDGELIDDVKAGMPDQGLLSSCERSIDLSGMLLIPGAIDDQVHFRDPGLTHKADIASESLAAIAGGVTSFMDMPNTKPQTTTLEALESKYEHAAEVSAANYSFYIGATNDNIDTVKNVDFSQTCGVKAFLGSSTGNMLVDNPQTLERLFGEVPALIAIHSEDEKIIRTNRELFTQKYGDDLPVEFHPLIRSVEACYESTARAIELAKRLNTRLHILHLSTARELELLNDSPLSQKRITAEVCVHHLWFCDKDYKKYGNRIKCNPAIKTAADRDALREGLLQNKLDIVATDHAPHLLSEKVGNCLVAASGAPLVQFSLVAMLELAHQNVFSIEKVVEKMCHAPADLYHIDRRGYIRKGYYADLVVVNPNEPHTITASDVLSKCGWSPFEGSTMHNSVARTFLNGEEVYSNGIFKSGIHGMRLKFNIH